MVADGTFRTDCQSAVLPEERELATRLSRDVATTMWSRLGHLARVRWVSDDAVGWCPAYTAVR